MPAMPDLAPANTKAGKLQRECWAVLQDHEVRGSIPTSVRFVFYELEGLGVVPKNYYGPDGKKKARTPSNDVADAIKRLRDVGLVPWNWIVDETRNLDNWRYAESVYQYVEDTIDLARIDLWQGEPPPLILCESRSLAGVLRRIAGNYLCPIAATNGQAGGFLRTDVGPLMSGGARQVLYFGDLDLSGGQIEEHTRDVLSEFGECEWLRLGITKEQVKDGGLTEIMKTDNRFKPAREFPAVETEALSQEEIQRLLRQALEDEVPEPLATVVGRERKQRVLVRQALRPLRDQENGDEDLDEDEEVEDANEDPGVVPDFVIDSLSEEIENRISEVLHTISLPLPFLQHLAPEREIQKKLSKRLLRLSQE